MIFQFVVDRAFFCKGGTKSTKITLQNIETIDAHKVNHIITPNQFLAECESSIPSPTDMGKPTLTIVDQSLTGALEIEKEIKKM